MNLLYRLRETFLFAVILLTVSLTAVSIQPAGAQTAAPSQAAVRRPRILVINGPNINLLGRREPAIYGNVTLEEINRRMKALADELKVDLIFVQTNSEGTIVDTFQQHFDDVDGAILNPAGYSQHSIAIHDVIKAVPYPTIEVHISNIAGRDPLHQADVVMPAVKSAVVGFGWRGYLLALRGLADEIKAGEKK